MSFQIQPIDGEYFESLWFIGTTLAAIVFVFVLTKERPKYVAMRRKNK